MTEAGYIYGRGISFPPRIDANGHVAWSEGTQNIRESIKVILLTELGERLMLTEFGAGLKQFLYEPNTVETRRLLEEQITQALEQWEPRLQLQEVNVAEDANDSQQAIATINYKLIATQQTERVSVQLNLGS